MLGGMRANWVRCRSFDGLHTVLFSPFASAALWSWQDSFDVAKPFDHGCLELSELELGHRMLGCWSNEAKKWQYKPKIVAATSRQRAAYQRNAPAMACTVLPNDDAHGRQCSKNGSRRAGAACALAQIQVGKLARDQDCETLSYSAIIQCSSECMHDGGRQAVHPKKHRERKRR